MMSSAAAANVDEEDGTLCGCCAPLAALSRPVDLAAYQQQQLDDSFGGGGCAAPTEAFWTWPIFGPLLFENTNSDARDHLALERTFLSYLRLAVTMAVVAVAIVLSFHLKHQPTALELRMARPLGAIFWTLSVFALAMGVGNYIKTVNKYSRRMAIVQTGWKTQSVMGIIALCIVGSCITLLVINKLSQSVDED